MANTWTGAQIELWTLKSLPVLRQNAIMPRLCETDLGKTPREKGYKVTITGGAAMTTSTKTIGSDYTVQNFTAAYKTITLDQYKENTFKIEPAEVSRAPEFITKQLPYAYKALVNTVDAALLSNYASAANNSSSYGTTLTSAIVATALGVYDGTGVGIMDDETSLVVNPAGWWALNQDTNFISASVLGGEQTMITGLNRTGASRYGIKVFPDHNVNTTTATPTQVHNLLFHKSGIGFASAPLSAFVIPGVAGFSIQEVVDPISQLACTQRIAYDAECGGFLVTVECLYGHTVMNTSLLLELKS